MKTALLSITVMFLTCVQLSGQSLVSNINFGNNGQVITNFNTDERTFLSCVARQPDGKIIIGGYPITRIFPDGKIDSSFNGTGTFLRSAYQIPPLGVVLQQDGKIIAMYGGNGLNFLRLNLNGTPDSTYGTNGIATVELSGTELSASKCIIQQDDKIVFAGVVGPSYDNLVVGRILSSGKLDTTFNGTGVTTVSDNPGHQLFVGALALQSTGKIVLASSHYASQGSHPVLTVVSYNSNGTRDNTFNGTGSYIYSIITGGGESVSGISIQADDKILLTGSSNGMLMVIKLKANGQPDNNFNGTGIYQAGNASFGNVIFTRPNGKILIAGNTVTYTGTEGEWDYGVTQLNENGTPDAMFGNGGTKVISVSDLDHNEGAILQPDGSLIMIGFANEFWLISMIKINSSGGIDNSFGNNGIKTLYLLGTSEGIENILVQPDKKIIAAGYKYPGVTDSSTIVFIRYKPDGRSLDSSFGTAGKAACRNHNIIYRSAALQSTGKLVVSGHYYDFNTSLITSVVSRLNSNGSADNSFGTNYEYVSAPSTYVYSPTNIVVLNDDRILFCQNLPADGGGYITVTRLTGNGFPDNSFGINGTVTLEIDTANYFAKALVLQPDGKLLISGEQNLGDSITRFVLIRLLDNGDLDNSFDTDGIKGLPLMNSYLGEGGITVKMQPDGKILVAVTTTGYDANDDEVTTATVFRLNDNGTPDLAFNNTGIVSLQSNDSNFPNVSINSFTLHLDKSIYLTGGVANYDSGTKFLVRIKSNGVIDSTLAYDNDGMMPVDNKWITGDIVVLPDSSILLGGSITRNDNNNSDFLLANYKKLTGGFRFTGNGNWTQPSNWEGGSVPPSTLPVGSYIYIQPAEGGKCILNTVQHVSLGASIVVGKDRELVITGGLYITR